MYFFSKQGTDPLLYVDTADPENEHDEDPRFSDFEITATS